MAPHDLLGHAPAAESPFDDGLIDSHAEPIDAAWCRPDGIFNTAFAIQIFENAHRPFMDALGIDADYRARTGCSTFALEGHMVFGATVRRGELVRVSSMLVGFDAKRLHAFHRIRRAADGASVAGYETMAVHVDLRARRSAPMPEALQARVAAVAARHALLPRPSGLGGRIALDGPAPDALPEIRTLRP